MKPGDFLRGLSVANIALFRAWFHAGGYGYLSAGLPMARARFGLLIDWLLLGLLLAALSAFSRRGRWPLRMVALAYALVLIVPFDWVLRQATGIILPIPGDEGWITGVAIVVVTTALLFRYDTLPWLLVDVAPVIVAPLMLVAVAHVGAPLFMQQADSPAHEAARLIPVRPTRVLWLMFDELDYRTIAGQRPGGPALPAFERLMRESLVATNATSSTAETLSAIPSIIAGRHVLSATPKGRSLMLTFAEGTETWESQASLFMRVRDYGLTTGAAGWFHPYCVALEGQFDDCYWEPRLPTEHRTASVADAALTHLQEAVFAFSPLVRMGLDDDLLTESQLERWRRDHAEAFRRIRDRGSMMARAQPEGLLLVHYPAPHIPGILDLVSPEGADVASGYYGNVVLADRTLAALRAELQGQGTWDDTVVVVSSDHHWRLAPEIDRRVALLVKLRGANPGVSFETPVALLVLHDLLPALASGEVATVEQLQTALSAERPAR